jgi:tetratricopeptide (TPR) repeat protein
MKKINKENVITSLRDILITIGPMAHEIIDCYEMDGKRYSPELDAEAIRSYIKKIENFEEIKEAYFLLSLAYLEQGEPYDALSILEDRMPEFWRGRWFYFLTGLAKIQKGDFKNAIDDLFKYHRTAKLSRRSPDVYYWIGYANYQLNNYFFAKGYFDLAIEKDSEFEEAYLARGMTYLKLGEEVNAKADFCKVLELNPGNEEAQNNLSLIKDIIKCGIKF